MNTAPTLFFLGYEFDGISISFQLASLRGLDTVEAHPTMGDWRDFAFSLCSTIQTRCHDMKIGDVLRARPPQQFPSSLKEGAVKQVYSFEFVETRERSAPDVVEERAAP